jgi:GAF domain-containing protein
MRDREEWLADTLVGLADTLIDDFDVIEFLSTLAERLVELLDAAEVGLVLADPQGRLRVMAASTERMRMLDLFEVQSNEGPCLECYRSGEPVLNIELDSALARWPVFTPMARSAGFHAVHALAMRLRDQVIGAVNIFHTAQVAMSERDAHLAQALADVATIGLLQERAVRHATDLSEQLQRALNSRVVIEQAKGVVAERATVDMDTAFSWLRGYARGNNRRLAEVAVAVVERSLAVDMLRGTGTGSPPPSRS